MGRKALLKTVSILLTVASFVFGAYILSDIFQSLNHEKTSIDAVYVLLSVGFFIVFYCTLSLHWQDVVDVVKGNPKTNLKKQYLAFFASQPYKYLPSSIFTFSFRAKYSKKLGLDVKSSSYAQLLENISILISAFTVFTFFFLLERAPYYLLPLIAISVLAYVLAPEKLRIKVVKKNTSISKKQLKDLLILSSVSWLFSGLSLFFIGVAVGSQLSVSSSIAANSISYAAGILAIFAPGGIGIRELVQKSFEVANPVVAVHRLMTLAVDFITGFVAIYAINQKES